MVYLIKLTEQKDANLILTRKCFTIAIKTIQLSSHITHDEFIKATFSSEIFFETNHIFAIRCKNPFLFHYVCEGGGHWGILETAKPKKKSSKTTKKFGQNRKPHTKPSENRYNGDKWGIQAKLVH